MEKHFTDLLSSARINSWVKDYYLEVQKTWQLKFV